jgi:hypothetical protein
VALGNRRRRVALAKAGRYDPRSPVDVWRLIDMLCGTDLVPIKYRGSSGLSAHTFRVVKASRGIPDFAHPAHAVRVLHDGQWTEVRVPVDSFPAEVEAISILAQVDGETEREGRYINVHSAYEAVVSSRAVHLSSIRHALAHPITSLTRPSVKAALVQRFGGPHIDFASHVHKKVYYQCLVEMLVHIDDALFATFNSRWHELVK